MQDRLEGKGDTLSIDKSEMITVTLLGEPGTGKTSIRNHLFGDPFEEQIAMTVGATYKTTQIKLSAKPIKLRICDIAGQSSFEIVRKHYFNRSDGALLVFDLTNINSFKKLTSWANEYLESHQNQKIPILLVGNKSDLEADRQVRLKDIEVFLRAVENNPVLDEHIIGYIETSAKTGENVNNGFVQISKAINNID
ncbi:MAG: Rab family GTPase [Candidatus Kariarchaeaceae archaeon]|jgi:small GTP-binding protein